MLKIQICHKKPMFIMDQCITHKWKQRIFSIYEIHNNYIWLFSNIYFNTIYFQLLYDQTSLYLIIVSFTIMTIIYSWQAVILRLAHSTLFNILMLIQHNILQHNI